MHRLKNFLLIFFFVAVLFGISAASVVYVDAKYEVEDAIMVLEENDVDYSSAENLGLLKKRSALRQIYIDYLYQSNPFTLLSTENMTEEQIVAFEEYSALYLSYVEEFKISYDYFSTNQNIKSVREYVDKFIELEEYLSSLTGVKVAVSFDSNDMHYGYNEDYNMAAASTIKVLVSLAVIDAINNGEVSPDQFVKYDKSKHYEGGAGYYQSVKNFTGATVWELVEKMIVYSDNIAWKMLYDVVSREEVFDYYTDLTGKEMKYTDTAYMTTSDTNIILTELYEHKDEPYYSDVFDWMAETENKTRIYAASMYEVHHKIGDLYVGSKLYTHDTAIVMAPEPYIISIMVEGVDYETNEEIIEDVIRIIEK